MSNKNSKSNNNFPLTREIIFAKALQLADEVGIENVSTRNISSALGKTPMALYRHCNSINEIHQGALALAFTEVDAEPIPGESWDDTVRRTTSSIHKMYKRHRNANLHKVSGKALSPGLQTHTNRIVMLHQSQGIPPKILERFWRIIDAFLTGFVVNESNELFDHEINQDNDGLVTVPEWKATVDEAYSEQAFLDGIEIIIAGIRKLAEPNPCNWRTPES